MQVELERVYDSDQSDGYRVLVDRIWPRGVSRESLRLDEWCREIAPSTELRKWFGHDPERWEAFKRRYREELELKVDVLDRLKAEARNRLLILLYSAKDKEHNQAVVIREALLEGG